MKKYAVGVVIDKYGDSELGMTLVMLRGSTFASTGYWACTKIRNKVEIGDIIPFTFEKLGASGMLEGAEVVTQDEYDHVVSWRSERHTNGGDFN